MNNTSIQIILLFLKNLCVYRGVIFKTLKKLAEADKTAKAENITVIEIFLADMNGYHLDRLQTNFHKHLFFLSPLVCLCVETYQKLINLKYFICFAFNASICQIRC